MNVSDQNRRFMVLGCISALIVFLGGLTFVRFGGCSFAPGCDDRAFLSVAEPARAEPDRFPPNTHIPAKREGLVSGSIDLATFSPERDLVYVDDPRVWWESDHDEDDSEDDHIIHKSMECPLRRLINLVCREGGTLKIHDAYRPTGIHNPTSLHKEGRAVDVTCDEFSLEKLAKLCWAAGFDWVYHEATSRHGAHIHCSVRR